MPHSNPFDAIGFAANTKNQAKRVGIIMHLASILPAGILVVFQFTPVIRHKFILIHRVNGYVVIILFFISVAGTFMMFPSLINYRPDVQIGLGVLGVGCSITITMAWINIRRLQIEQHRAWMLRTWVYAGSIISLRLIMIAARTVINRYFPDRHFATFSCGQIFDMYTIQGVPDDNNPTPLIYPECTPAGLEFFDRSLRAIVRASSNSYIVQGQVVQPGPEGMAAFSDVTFGMATWLALVLHVVGVELYLRLTPKEAERLRQVSYKKQLAAGMRNPGSSGLVVQNWGDAEKWEPLRKSVRKDEEERAEQAAHLMSRDYQLDRVAPPQQASYAAI